MLRRKSRNGRHFLVIVFLATLVIIGSLPESSFALQSMSTDDLRKIDGQEGLSEGFSKEFGTLSNFDASPVRPSPFVTTQSDTPLPGEYLLGGVLWFSDLQYTLIDNDLDSIRSISRDPLSFLSTTDPIVRDEDFFLNKKGVPRSTTGPIPEAIRDAHNL